MRIVVDTNVIISGVFFGGAPKQILNAIVAYCLHAREFFLILAF